MEKKYVMTNETKKYKGKILHRIKAIRNFGNINTGELGGWIENEKNLSHEGNCWVTDEAMVCGNSEVGDNAMVFNNAEVSGNAEVGDNAMVFDNAEVSGNAIIRGHAKVWGHAIIRGNAKVWGHAIIRGNAKVCGNAIVSGNAKVGGNVRISKPRDVITLGPIGSRDDFTTFINNDGVINVVTGCFNGTLDLFIEKVNSTHADSIHGIEYTMVIEFAKNFFGAINDK